MLCTLNARCCAGLCKAPPTCNSTRFQENVPEDVLTTSVPPVADNGIFCASFGASRSIRYKYSASLSVRNRFT